MNTVHRSTLTIALAGLLAVPAGAALAADEAVAKPAEASAPAATWEHMKAMRERMWQIQKTTDPAKRKELIAAQMKDMEAMMNNPDNSCPVGNAGMPEGKCGGGGWRGAGMKARHGDMLEERVEALEKRMDMMQMMQMRMGQGMPGMMQPNMMPSGMMVPGMMVPMMPPGMMMPAMPVK
jgi:hypothetical protein